MLALALLLLTADLREDVLCERCDAIEQNWFYDEHGKLIFRQLIFWDKDESWLIVRAWRLIKDDSRLPRRDFSQGDFVVTWDDGNALIRQVRASSYFETWTQQGVDGDRELNNRELLPKEHRRELLTTRRR